MPHDREKHGHYVAGLLDLVDAIEAAAGTKLTSVAPYREPATVVVVMRKRSWWWRLRHRKVMRVLAERDELARVVKEEEIELNRLGVKASFCWVRRSLPDDRDDESGELTLAGYRREAEFDKLQRKHDDDYRWFMRTKEWLERAAARRPDLFEEE